MKPLTKQQAEEKGYFVYSFNNGDYKYKIDNTEHIIRNGKEIAKGDRVYSYSNGDYEYKGNRHIFNRHGKEIC